jgi:hypothetical protein
VPTLDLIRKSNAVKGLGNALFIQRNARHILQRTAGAYLLKYLSDKIKPGEHFTRHCTKQLANVIHYQRANIFLPLNLPFGKRDGI